MDDRTLYLIDGHSLTFKAYYAIRNLRSPQGDPTGAVYGFLRMLLKFISDWKPDYLAVVFDTGKPSFRKELFSEYKANRQAPPPDFSDQMGVIYRLLKTMGVATYQLENFEADDVIATLAEQMKDQGWQTVVLTADKDLLQLVDGHVTVLRPGLNEIKRCDAAVVEELLGIRPDQVVDWLALVGDSSDNIPGVPGIGEKSAVELLRQFGTLEDLLARAEEVKKPRQRQSLLENAERARLARLLATIRRDVPVEWDLPCCRLPEDLFNPSVAALLAEFGFDSVLREKGLKAPAPAPAQPPQPRAAVVEQDDLFSAAAPAAPSRHVCGSFGRGSFVVSSSASGAGASNGARRRPF
jgi:DNA polymerase-1